MPGRMAGIAIVATAETNLSAKTLLTIWTASALIRVGEVTMLKIKKGMRFYHKYWLSEDLKQPAICIVTAVHKGKVYIKFPEEKKAHFYFMEWDADKSVREWINPIERS